MGFTRLLLLLLLSQAALPCNSQSRTAAERSPDLAAEMTGEFPPLTAKGKDSAALHLLNKPFARSASVPTDVAWMADVPVGLNEGELKQTAEDKRGEWQTAFDSRLDNADWQPSLNSFIEPIDFTEPILYQVEAGDDFNLSSPSLQSSASYQNSGVNSVDNTTTQFCPCDAAHPSRAAAALAAVAAGGDGVRGELLRLPLRGLQHA